MSEESASLAEIAVTLAREDGFAHVGLVLEQAGKRIDDVGKRIDIGDSSLNKRIDDQQGEMRILRAWVLGMYAPVIAGVVAILVAFARSLW